MNITVHIPDELAARLSSKDGDLERRVLESLALTEYQAGRLTRFELRQLLGIPTRFELDAFLKAHGVFDPCTLEDVQRDVEILERLGF